MADDARRERIEALLTELFDGASPVSEARAHEIAVHLAGLGGVGELRRRVKSRQSRALAELEAVALAGAARRGAMLEAELRREREGREG